MTFVNGASLNGHGHHQHGPAAGPSKTPTVTLAPQFEPSSSTSLTPTLEYAENGDEEIQFQQDHDASIVSHIYEQGFQKGNYADINLIVLHRSYRLHRLILSQSPYLDHLILSSRNGQIYIPLEQFPHITEEAFAIVLGYLYANTSINLIKPENARSVLAAACLLGGMEDLCAHAYELCKSSISAESIYEWLEFLATIPFTPSPSSSSPSSPRAGTPTTPDASLPMAPDSTSVFGPYAARLREDIFGFLVVTLPGYLGVGPGTPPSEALIGVYARLPFDYFKAAIESPNFPIGSTQDRFKFAKAAIVERKKSGMARDAEETVVLAFGGVGDSGSAVHVTRKLRKRPLWKVTK